MENQFYVGQRVKVIDNDETWTTRSDVFKRFGFKELGYNEEFSNGEEGIIFAFELIGKEYCIGLTHSDGRQCLISNYGIIPIDPPRIVLTEWQEKKLRILLMPIADKINGDIDVAINRINAVLSEPEPPKFVPKEGDVCLFRDENKEKWMALLFTGMVGERYGSSWFFTGEDAEWKQCRPFDPALVGKVTND